MSPRTTNDRSPRRSWRKAILLACLALPALVWWAGYATSEDVQFSTRGTLGNFSFEASAPVFTAASPVGAGLDQNNYRDVQRRRGPPGPRSPLANQAAPGTGPRAKPLLIDQPLDQAISDPAYVSQVGGVAFDRVAEPEADVSVAGLRAVYDYALPDGQRLVLFADGQPWFTADLPDWQLAPIVHFADSPQTAVVTLFGELENPLPPEQDEQVAYIVAFHPAFEQTLLGLRLFQTDFMLLDNSLTGELPRFKNRYLLGPQEEIPNPSTWGPAAEQLATILSSGKFTSYVICDQGVAVTFRPRRNARQPKKPPVLEMSGGLRFHFWTEGPRVQVQQGNVLIDTFTVEAVPSLTDAVYGAQPLLEQANPQVYAASVNTLRYAALFRYLKKQDAAQWQAFVDQVGAGIPRTRYAAPTPVLIFRRPGDPVPARLAAHRSP